MNRNIGSLLVSACIMNVFVPSVIRADGMPEAAPKRRVKTVEARHEVEPVKKVEASSFEPCEWKFRLSPGMTVWFFKEEGDLPAPALYADFWRTDLPLNFRVGVEGRHMYLSQDAAKFAMEWEDKTTRVTFIKIPFALEYMHPVAKSTTWYIGGGPDILHTANDISETNVGLHLGSRLHYAFDERFGVALEAGYSWGNIDGEGKDIELDHAYITPTVTYTF